MLIIRKNQTNNLIATVSMNKTLANPYYLFSFQHIASKERISFIPQVITSNIRYDKFRFVEAPTSNLSLTPPNVFFEYLGQYYYSIYEQVSSGNTDPTLAYNKLESGRAWVIVGNDDMDECFFEPYISNDEDFAQVIYVSEEEENCIYPNITPSITPSNSPTPSITPSNTPTNTTTPTYTPTPTLTPTPSSTPPSDNPAALNALWWIDFTDAATITPGTNATSIQSAVDKISSVVFTANTSAGGGPVYFTNGYLGVSGDARSNATQLQNPESSYGTFTDYTWFGTVYDDPSAQRGGRFFIGTNNGVSWPTGTAFSIMLDGNFNPYPPGPVWRFQNRCSGGASTILDTNLTFNNWTFVAMRSYTSGSDCVFEVWENGSIITSGSVVGQTSITVNDPIFSLLFDGGIDFSTEQFFFDRKLTNVEMTQMFTYLTNKY